jgi:hypothetical protein
MEKEYRAGADTRVALVAHMRRVLADATPDAPSPESSEERVA